MTIVLELSTKFDGASTGGTTPAVTPPAGTNLFCLCVTQYQAAGLSFVSDSVNGAVYTQRTRYDGVASGVSSVIYDLLNPTLGSNMTFTADTTANFACFRVLCFSGVKTTSAFDAITGFGNTASQVATIQPGSQTPGQANDVFVLNHGWVGNSGGGTATCDSGFTVTNQIPFSAGNHFGGGTWYLIQGAAAAINPTLTLSANDWQVASMATYKAAPAASVGIDERAYPRGISRGVTRGSASLLPFVRRNGIERQLPVRGIVQDIRRAA